jgi:hypothetical protein
MKRQDRQRILHISCGENFPSLWNQSNEAFAQTLFLSLSVLFLCSCKTPDKPPPDPPWDIEEAGPRDQWVTPINKATKRWQRQLMTWRKR